MEKRFRALRVVGTIYKVIAWIVLILGILIALGTFGVSVLSGINAGGGLGGRQGILPGLAVGGVGGLLGGIGILVVTLFYFLLLYSVGDLIYLALAVEENTRETVMLLRDLRPGPSAAPAPAETPPPA